MSILAPNWLPYLINIRIVWHHTLWQILCYAAVIKISIVHHRELYTFDGTSLSVAQSACSISKWHEMVRRRFPLILAAVIYRLFNVPDAAPGSPPRNSSPGRRACGVYNFRVSFQNLNFSVWNNKRLALVVGLVGMPLVLAREIGTRLRKHCMMTSWHRNASVLLAFVRWIHGARVTAL